MLKFIKEKIELINKYCYHLKDTGSSEIQIILLSFRINIIDIHLKTHNKDKHSRLGLLNLITKRKKLLNYLKIKNFSIYLKLVFDLNLKK